MRVTKISEVRKVPKPIRKVHLDAEQQAALEADGTILLVAGAGSGKTRVITHKIAYLTKHGCSAERILSITFTNKAADEMADRLASPGLLGKKIDKGAIGSPWISTMHSFFYRVLREDLPVVDNRYSPRITILDDSKARIMIQGVLKVMGFTEDDPQWNPTGIQNAIALAQAAGYLYDSARPLFFSEHTGEWEELCYTVWGEYIRAKLRGDDKGNKYVDFNDMISLAVDMFRKHPNVLEKWQSRFDYILVDEYQDTDVLQAELVRLLAEKHQRLMVVADPRQSVYSFRGAVPKLTTDFLTYYPHGQVYFISTNYRSTKSIVRNGNSLIRSSNLSLPDIRPRDTADEGTITYLGHLPDENAEADEVGGTIRSLISGGRKPGDFAVLYRCNAQSAAIEDFLMKNGIPYVIQGSTGFYAREEVKDIIAYMAIIYDIMTEFKDLETRERVSCLMSVNTQRSGQTGFGAWERVINRPNRYLGRIFVSEWGTKAVAYDPLTALRTRYSRPFMSANAGKLADHLDYLVADYMRNQNLSRLVGLIRTRFDYDTWITRNFPESTDNPKIENLNTLSTRFYDVPGLREFLIYASSAAKPESDNGVDAVHLMTVHRAKGLEFDVVFTIGLSENTLPHWASISAGDVEEERRIMYVALTRAKDLAFLSGSAVRNTKPTPDPSRFLKEILVDGSDNVES